MKAPFPPFVRGGAWLAGGVDLLTGIGLLVAPAFTLERAGLPVPSADALEFVRFVGAFVAATGLSYLTAVRRRAALAPMLSLTRLPRLAAGAFTLTMVLSGRWSPPWLLVSVTDLLLVAVQSLLLARYDDL